jgi:hypothetical protein
LILSALLGGLIVATASRGGLVALVAGLCACWIAAGFPRPEVRRLFGVLAAVLILVGMAVFGRMGSRVAGSSLEDGSIASRLTIYSQVPAMMVAAPGGWGWGNAAEAYENWFQEKDDTRVYKHLVSTHATWLVEAGWGFRLGYVWGWLAVLLLCWRNPAAFGIWMAFGTAGVFSHVGADGRLWLLPAVAVTWVLVERGFRHAPPPFRAWVVCGVAGGIVIAALAWLGHWRGPSVRFYGDHLTAGDGRPALWFFTPDPRVLTRSYGKVLREYSPVGVFWEKGLPVHCEVGRVVFSGNAKEIPPLEGGYDLVWLNPPGRLSEMQKKVVIGAKHKIVVWGELRTDASSRELKPWFNSLPGTEWWEIPGDGLLFTRMPDLWRAAGE